MASTEYQVRVTRAQNIVDLLPPPPTRAAPAVPQQQQQQQQPPKSPSLSGTVRSGRVWLPPSNDQPPKDVRIVWSRSAHQIKHQTPTLTILTIAMPMLITSHIAGRLAMQQQPIDLLQPTITHWFDPCSYIRNNSRSNWQDSVVLWHHLNCDWSRKSRNDALRVPDQCRACRQPIGCPHQCHHRRAVRSLEPRRRQ
jgi:hypothetical protein